MMTTATPMTAEARTVTSGNAAPTTNQGSAVNALALRNEARRQGLLEFRPSWYTTNLLIHTGLYAGLMLAFTLAPSLWWAIPLGFAYYQVGLLFHDYSHFQAYRTRAHNDWAGLFVGLLIGASLGRWRRDHDAHHAHTNDLTRDPDLDGPLAHTVEGAQALRGPARLLAATQHIWLLPLSCLLLMPILRSKDIAFVLTQRHRLRKWESLVLVAHYGLYAVLVFSTLSLVQGLLFIALHQTAFGTFFSLAFVANHYGLPVRHGKPSDAIGAQIESARNLLPGTFSDYLLGPLGAHIEHHVFPGMPRCNQRRATGMIQEYAKATGATYREHSLASVHPALLGALRQLALHARKRSGSAA
jgi:fatty acid desaturase